MKQIQLKVFLAASLLLGGIGASSAGFSRGIFGQLQSSATSYQSSKLIEDGIDYLLYAKASVRAGNHYQSNKNVRKAFYKLKMASMMLGDGYQFQDVKQELDVAMMKLSDHGLSLREKINYGLACSSFSLSKLADKSPIKIMGAKQVVKVGLKLADYRAIKPLKVLLLNTGSLFHAPLTHKAGKAVQVAIDKLEDPYLNRQEKIQFAKHCLNVALNKL